MYEGFQISPDMSHVSEGVCCNSSCTVLNTEHKDKEEYCEYGWMCNGGVATTEPHFDTKHFICMYMMCFMFQACRQIQMLSPVTSVSSSCHYAYDVCKQFKVFCPVMYKIYEQNFWWQLSNLLRDMLTVITAVWYFARCY